MTLASSRAEIATAQGGRYVEQLCRHWSHKLVVEHVDDQARITMPSGAVVALDASADRLDLAIEAPDAATLAETKDVVASHLDRFAFREAPLAFAWTDRAVAPEA